MTEGSSRQVGRDAADAPRSARAGSLAIGEEATGCEALRARQPKCSGHASLAVPRG
jgi:hypothetical protein